MSTGGTGTGAGDGGTGPESSGSGAARGGGGGRSGGIGGGRGPTRRPGGRPGFTVLEGFAGRRSALPFALVVLVVLGAGLVGVLVLNTAIDHGAFQLQQSQQRQTDLTNQQQKLQQQVAGLSAPGPLASAAARLGMVPNLQPAFLDPSAGAVLGVPSVAASPTPAPTTAAPTTAPPPAVAPTATGTATAPTGANSVPGTRAPVPTATATRVPSATPDPSASTR
jgi:hypothetical protein